MQMKSCSIQNIPEDVWRKFRSKCVAQGLTINEKLIQMIQEESEKPITTEERNNSI
jgi:hypothetical protein